MTRDETIRQTMRRLKNEVQRAVSAARGGPAHSRINVARRSNVIVSTNVDRDGAVSGVSARQSAPIYQGGRGEHESPAEEE